MVKNVPNEEMGTTENPTLDIDMDAWTLRAIIETAEELGWSEYTLLEHLDKARSLFSKDADEIVVIYDSNGRIVEAYFGV